MGIFVTDASSLWGGPPFARYIKSGVVSFTPVVLHPKNVGLVVRFCARNSAAEVGTEGKE